MKPDFLLAYSCKRRCFCPSCHHKRALLFAEHVEQNVLGEVPIRQYVATIPKMLRLCFKYDRKLLGELSRCFYESIKEIFLAAAPQAGCSPTDPPRASSHDRLDSTVSLRSLVFTRTFTV
jgi:hypothetical protein